MKASRSDSLNRLVSSRSEEADFAGDRGSSTILPFGERLAPPVLRMNNGCPTAGPLDRRTQAALGQNLRVVFEHIASEPVPDRFLKLLQELEAKEKQQ